MKQFRFKWVEGEKPRFHKLLGHFKGAPDLKFLEIGAFEGYCSNFLLEEFLTNPTSQLFVMDTFEGSVEHGEMGLELSSLYATFLNNVSEYSNQVVVLKGKSQDLLKNSEVRKHSFDFIYVDGCHEAKETLEDAVLSFDLLKPRGIMIFDDYLWGEPLKNPFMTPKVAIDSFVKTYGKYLKVVDVGYQLAIEKL